MAELQKSTGLEASITRLTLTCARILRELTSQLFERSVCVKAGGIGHETTCLWQWSFQGRETTLKGQCM